MSATGGRKWDGRTTKKVELEDAAKTDSGNLKETDNSQR